MILENQNYYISELRCDFSKLIVNPNIHLDGETNMVLDSLLSRIYTIMNLDYWIGWSYILKKIY